MGKLSEWKSGLGHAWGSLAEGWHELRDRAAGALTRFKSGGAAGDEGEPPFVGSWGFLAADVFGDDQHLVVRIEAPGMRRDDFELEIYDRLLIVHGRKRWERESKSARYHLVQCAYGSFRRVVELPVPVKADGARATYRDGVLRVELPKREAWRTHRVSVH